MANDYYDNSTPGERFISGEVARGTDVDAKFDAVETGFGKLPTEAELKQGRATYATDTGVADAYVVSLPYAPTSYVAGLSVVMLAANANTGSSTINVNSLGAKSIIRPDGSALSAGDIQAGGFTLLIYDGTNFQLGASTMQMVADAEAAQSYAEEWATKAEDALVSTAAGGDGATDYSSLHHAAKASASAASASSSASAAATSESNAAAHEAAAAAYNPNPAVVDKGTVSSGTVTFSVSGGTKQKLTVGGDLTIATSDWPTTGNYGELEIELVNGGAHVVTMPTVNWLVGDGTSSTTFADIGITLEAAGSNTLILWTGDAGTTLYGVAG